MKTLLTAAGMFTCLLASAATNADSTGKAGDHLDLAGVLELFKQSANLEAFEKALNQESNHVNNLDLNNDGDVDYIRVVDHSEKNNHAIVLQVPVNEKESQDVAIIEIEKKGENSAQLQIVGNEDVYGEKYYVEPKQTEAEKTKFMMHTYNNVWMWTCVVYLYGPHYTLWMSPWHWRHYPRWWRTWRCVGWRTHWNHVHHYHVHYTRVYTHHVIHAHNVYHPHRKSSPTYRAKYHAPKNNGKPRDKKVGPSPRDRKNPDRVHKNGGHDSHKNGNGNRNGNRNHGNGSRENRVNKTPKPVNKGGGGRR